jgi:hypothetical protein
MTLIRPRLTEFYGVFRPQQELDFAIPVLDEDIPLYVDPFLLWKSPSYQDKSLHGSLLNIFNHIGYLSRTGSRDRAIAQLVIASECDEVGMGLSAHRKGKRIGKRHAEEIIELFARVPEFQKNGFRHFEEIQLFVDGISKDRISDFACNMMKSFLIDFTIDQCEQLGLPLHDCTIRSVYNLEKYDFDESVEVKLPINPKTSEPILLVPKRWLRFTPWINYDDYFKDYCPIDRIFQAGEEIPRVKVLNYNREHYDLVDRFIAEKERTFEDCKTDPLFSQIPVISAKRKLSEILKLPSGKTENADRKYEDAICQLMASLLYPHLDFAAEQSRTDSGINIRDAIFYNNRSHEFLKEIFDDYDSQQIVMELKNVRALERQHINQLNRYMTDTLGRFGILVTRVEPPKPRRQNLVDLWSGQRRAIITLTDEDVSQMVELFESKQRVPLDVVKKKYVEFRRQCPS